MGERVFTLTISVRGRKDKVKVNVNWRMTSSEVVEWVYIFTNVDRRDGWRLFHCDWDEGWLPLQEDYKLGDYFIFSDFELTFFESWYPYWQK